MDLVNHLSDRLLFAIPKKGRLQQATLDLLAGSDIQFRRETRLDIALVKNLPIALIFLPAADIPTFVGEGRVDIGITGADQVAEHDAKLLPGEQSGVEQNVVTSFTGLTEEYFAKLEGVEGRVETVNGSAIKIARLRTKIKFVGGSVEAACALGVADGIVDLVESGETMRAAGLKAIDTVVESSAVLIKSRHASNAKLANLIQVRIRGIITAQRYVLCQYNISRDKLAEATSITPGRRAPTITSLEEPGWVAVSSMVEKNRIASAMDDLAGVGATDVLVLEISNSRTI
ncbi:hypothetical protein DV735_g869, partial [Chaetothyriales sp. CBS 134920]